MRSEAPSGWRAKAKQVTARLKAEYEAGKQGDESPAEPIWATPQQQFNGLMVVFRNLVPTLGEDDEPHAAEPCAGASEWTKAGQSETWQPETWQPETRQPETGPLETGHWETAASKAAVSNAGDHDVPVATDTDEADEADEAEEADAARVADAIRGVDWAAVRESTVERTADATRAMKSMADHVDWGKVQPVVAQVSSALIAAIASGQLGLGGRLASTVARAVTNQNGLGQRVAEQLDRVPADRPPDFRPTIDAVSREESQEFRARSERAGPPGAA